eukprot:181675-Amphidinium_carterae.2
MPICVGLNGFEVAAQPLPKRHSSRLYRVKVLQQKGLLAASSLPSTLFHSVLPFRGKAICHPGVSGAVLNAPHGLGLNVPLIPCDLQHDDCWSRLACAHKALKSTPAVSTCSIVGRNPRVLPVCRNVQLAVGTITAGLDMLQLLHRCDFTDLWDCVYNRPERFGIEWA